MPKPAGALARVRRVVWIANLLLTIRGQPSPSSGKLEVHLVRASGFHEELRCMPDLPSPQFELLRLEPEAKAKPKKRSQTDEERRRKRAEYQRAWRLRNLEKVRESGRAYQRRYREENPEKIAAIKRIYKELHREEIARKDREYRKRHPRTEWQAAHPERMREYRRKWTKAHPDYMRNYHAKRKSQSVIHESPDKIYRSILGALPSSLPRHVRDDVASSLCLAVLEGKVLVKNIVKAAGEFLRAYNREYDTFKTVSLDETIPGTTMTRLDKLATR